MGKAILIMDMPESCYDCRYCNGKGSKHPSCALTNYAGGYQTMLVDEIRSRRSSWCPLRELPEKMEICGKYPQPDGIVPSYKVGWNACIDAMERRGANE